MMHWSCAGQDSREIPAVLIVYPNAKDVNTHTEPNGQVSMIYRVDQNYPAQEILNHLKEVLMAKRWTPLMTDWLNPDIPSSHARGWTKWIDGTVTPNTRVHQWFAEWKNDKGDIVLYELRYDSRLDSYSQMTKPPDNSRLRVTGIFVPRELAVNMRELAVKFQSEKLDEAGRPNPSLQSDR
jgi:hypothetical protein